MQIITTGWDSITQNFIMSNALHRANLPNLSHYKTLTNRGFPEHQHQTSQKLRNCPNSRYSKYSRYSRIVKFGHNCEIWSTPISLVWKSLTEFITIGQTQTFSRIAIRGCSLNISKNHPLPLGLLSKCICHRHGLCLCLCCCLFVGSGHVLLSL